MRNIKLTIEYEGTAYLGWQRQPQGMTIQQALEEALKQITGEMPQVIGASRTDAGVHARGQVANFKTDSAIPVERIQGALNALLPLDIAIVAAEEVAGGLQRALLGAVEALSLHDLEPAREARARPPVLLARALAGRAGAAARGVGSA